MKFTNVVRKKQITSSEMFKNSGTVSGFGCSLW